MSFSDPLAEAANCNTNCLQMEKEANGPGKKGDAPHDDSKEDGKDSGAGSTEETPVIDVKNLTPPQLARRFEVITCCVVF